MGALTKEIQLSRTRLPQVFYEDFRYISYLIKAREMLCESNKTKNIYRHYLLLTLFLLTNKTAGLLRFFSDRKTVIYVCKNCYNPPSMLTIQNIGPLCVKAIFRSLSAIFSKENATPPYFFKTCERVTKKNYLYLLLKVYATVTN